MADSANSGFTIIELILFLALSGLFLLIALAGVGGRTGQVQFTDSMRSLSSYLHRQYNDTLNGVNLRDQSFGCFYTQTDYDINFTGSDFPGASECSFMGKLVVFNDQSDQAETYMLVGRFLSQTVGSGDKNYLDTSRSDKDLIADAQPVILDDRLTSTYDLEWQSQFIDTTGSDPTAIAFIRSPRSSSIYSMTFTPDLTNGNPPYIDFSSVNIEADASYCFLGANGQDAEIIVGSGSNRSDRVELAFDTGCSA